jgi:hypothetical protein
MEKKTLGWSLGAKNRVERPEQRVKFATLAT